MKPKVRMQVAVGESADIAIDGNRARRARILV
eukprot:SAG22_NODE_7095_length_777_cov_1.215339_1_plen_31_part_10